MTARSGATGGKDIGLNFGQIRAERAGGEHRRQAAAVPAAAGCDEHADQCKSDGATFVVTIR